MKKFAINKTTDDHWTITHNEFPKFTCKFENKKFNISRTINGLENPMGDPKEVRLLQRMEQWLLQYHKDKTV